MVLPNLVYGLSVYGASEAKISTVQCFLNRYFRRNYISYNVNIRALLENQGRRIYSKVFKLEGHPLYHKLPKAAS